MIFRLAEVSVHPMKQLHVLKPIAVAHGDTVALGLTYVLPRLP